MPAEDPLEDLFEDLEQQAAGLHLAERDAELAERGAAEYVAVDLAGRLHASVGRRIAVRLVTLGTLEGTLARVGTGWFLVDTADRGWVVATSAAHQLSGLSPQSVSEPLRGAAARLTIRAPLRELRDGGSPVLFHLRGGERLRATVLRVGGDFVEVLRDDVEPGDGPVLLPLDGIAAVRTG